jgi:hypothetical protein
MLDILQRQSEFSDRQLAYCDPASQRLRSDNPVGILPITCEGASNLCHTAIDKQLDVDKAAVVTSEKDNGFGNLIGRAYSSQWNIVGLAIHELLHLLVTQSQVIVTRSRNYARANRHLPKRNGVPIALKL